jgi:hypothetical protein
VNKDTWNIVHLGLCMGAGMWYALVLGTQYDAGRVGSLLGVMVPILILVWVTMGAYVLHVDYIFTHKHNEIRNITRHIRFSQK